MFLTIIHICNQDLLRQSSQSYHAEHGDINSVIEAVKKISKLSAADKEKAARENKSFYMNQFSKKKSFAVISEEVLKLPKVSETMDPQELPETYAHPS